MKPIVAFVRFNVVVAIGFLATTMLAAAWTPKVLGWEGLQPNLSPQQVAMVLEPKIGRPLIVTKTKSGVFETWNYDNGGCVMFVHGMLDYWTASKLPKLPSAQPAKEANRAARR